MLHGKKPQSIAAFFKAAFEARSQNKIAHT
jgi:hypothetical protein